MLKGSSKAVQAENARTMRQQGMTEKERALVSMKRSKSEKSKAEASLTAPTPNAEEYPYGLRLDLDESTLSKLGLDEMPNVGDVMGVTAKAKVTRVEQSNSDMGGSHKSIALQITDLQLGQDGDADKDE